ncbi:MAG: MFS transporter [Candidatus Micrarchaeia archaeon]
MPEPEQTPPAGDAKPPESAPAAAVEKPGAPKALSREDVERSLDYSIKDGTAYSAMVGFGDTYLTPFALRLGATNAEIGLLVGLPQLFASVAQQVSAHVTERFRKRRSIIVAHAFLQGLMWLPILLTPFLFPQTPVPFLILFACLYAGFAAFAALPWASMMGDLVPEDSRGAYFGKRNEITGFAAFVTAAVAGSALGWFDANGELFKAVAAPGDSWLVGFSFIFFVAFLARMVSVGYLKKMSEPAYEPAPGQKLSLFDFVRRMRKEDFGVFTLYAALTQFATNLAAPFFTVYVLQVLEFDYGTFAIFMAALTFTQLISMTYWGSLADKYGNKTVLNVAGFLIPIVPLLWLFSQQPTYLIFAHAVSGFAWAGFNLLTFNYVLDATEPSTRPRYIAHFNFLNTGAVFAGALLGGVLAAFFADKRLDVFPGFAIEGLLLLFMVSGLLRLIIASALLPKVKETRLRYDINEHEFFWKVTAIYPARGVIQQLEGAWHLGEGAIKLGAKSIRTIEEKTAAETVKLGEKLKRKIAKKK